MQTTSEAGRWLEFAAEDLRAAEALLERDDLPPRLACFHAQQAAEKAIKAMLISKQIPFGKTHDLLSLVDLLPENLNVGSDRRSLGNLARWAVEIRYPGDAPDATLREAHDALGQAASIAEAIASLIEEGSGLLGS